MLKLNADLWTSHNGGHGLKDQRDEMRLSTALIGLKFEVESNGLNFTRFSSFKVVKEYFMGLKRTKEGAYNQLVDAGIYDVFVKWLWFG